MNLFMFRFLGTIRIVVVVVGGSGCGLKYFLFKNILKYFFYFLKIIFKISISK
jgi:hypothetical protein